MKFPILQFFDYGHLPDHLQTVSEPFAAAAGKLMTLYTGSVQSNYVLDSADPRRQLHLKLMEHLRTLPRNDERSVAFGKLHLFSEAMVKAHTYPKEEALNRMFRLLLEAKDCAVRAVLFKEPRTAIFPNDRDDGPR